MKTLIIFIFLLMTTESFAHILPPMARLNRLSRVLRGIPPTPEERQELQKALLLNQGNSFFDKKIDAYLNSENHADQMVVRLEDLFWLRTTSRPLSHSTGASNPLDPSLTNADLYDQTNALSFLFADLATKNLSWDSLLTEKSYRLTDLTSNLTSSQTDFGFLAALVPTLKSAYGGVFSQAPPREGQGPLALQEVQFKESDPRIAGALTTSRFFNRYTTTGLNKNRRRAATVFRIFMCDTMSAQIPSSSKQDDLIFDLMFPHDSTMTEADLRAAASDKLHGTQKDCMKCHYKLDPMGKTFLTSPMSLSPQASPGHLTFKRGDSELVDIKVAGLGELGKAIVQQPEYAACQVQHFWDWFIFAPTRIPLSEEKKNFLMREFDRVGRRTNDFVRLLVNQPEFAAAVQPMTESQMAASQVKQVLGKCQNCHNQVGFDSLSNEPFADFLVWPIGGDKAEMEKWIGRMSEVLDLPHNGENPSMPPSGAKWKPGYEEFQILKNWIESGAPNDKGQKQVGS